MATLGNRIGQGAQGTGARGAAATGITAASETLRTVAALTNALTNTAGVTASIGFSKSKSTTATQEQAVVGSTIGGGTVNITARGADGRSAENGSAGDINVRGSSITSTGNTSLTAARDVILESAQNQIDSQFASKSSGASLGVTVGVAVVGGVTASASVGVNASRSSGTSTQVTQANATVTAGGTLALTTGRDATLKGAVAQGKDVVATIGRDLNVVSVADTSARDSTSAGFSAGLTLARGVGLGANGSVNAGKGSGSSSIVSEQTALLAREGSLAATVNGNTDLKGGVIAALDATGKDTGNLNLTTATLTASDIKDSAKSRDVSVGVSASVNNITNKNVRSANDPVVDASFASTNFKQDTKATIGQGVLSVGVPDANVSADAAALLRQPANVNRDIDQSQIVTKDTSTAFKVHADPAALRELVSLVKGIAGNENAAANSVILQGVEAVKSLSDNKVGSSPFDKAVSDAFRLIAGRSAAAQADARSVAADKRFVKADGTTKTASEITDIRIGDAIAATRAQFGEAAAADVAAELRDPALRASLDRASGVIIAFKQGGFSDPTALAEATTNGKPRVAGSSFIKSDGSESVVTAGSRTFGDDVIVVLDTVGGKISALERENPRTASALSFTLGLLISGPVGAVGDVVVGKAVEAELARNKAARDGLVTVVNEVGLRATTALSSTSLERDRESAEFGKFATENNVLKAGATVLGIETIATLLRRAGDIIPGGGINPNAGDVPDVPKVDVPNGPAKPNFDRINGFLDAAPNRIAELRGALTGRAGARTGGTVAVADVDIPGVPRELAGHSRIDAPRDGFVGDGNKSLPFTREPDVNGRLEGRNIDAEYRILDNIADRLGNNPNAAGRVTIFVEIKPCNSCANVALTEFRRRYPNVQVEIKFNGTRIAPAPRIRPGG